MSEYDSVEKIVTDCADQCMKLANDQPENRGVLYVAGRMLKAYNALFAMNWSDVASAEERMKNK